MSQYKTQDIRNVAIVGHAGSGKTLLAEALLHRAGAIAERGELTRGTTVCDFDPQERAMQHSINVAMCHLDYNGHRINLLDTPGHEDFSEDTYRTLTAADSAIMVLDAAKGIEPQTRKLFEVCRQRGVPIFTFMNKCDRPMKNPLELLDELERASDPNVTELSGPLIEVLQDQRVPLLPDQIGEGLERNRSPRLCEG